MGHRPSTLRAWGELATEARELIQRRCAEPDLRIDEIARALNVSRSKLQRALAEADTDYTRELLVARMDRAARTLARGYWVRVARQQAGFRNPSHFAATFRACFGISPRSFKRAMRLNQRLQWRVFRDEIDPVRPGSSEYFRRRRRWADDERELHRIVRRMNHTARSAMHELTPPPRTVLRPARWQSSYRAPDRAQDWDHLLEAQK